MSNTVITMVALGVLLSACFILRWQRHFIMRWICPSEIFLLESVEERNHVCDRGYIAFLKHWRTWITFVMYSAALALTLHTLSGFIIAVTRVGQWSSTGVKLAVILCTVGPWLLLIPLMFAMYRKWMRAFLREYLNEHGIAVCRSCGYDLRGQAHPLCPECGADSGLTNAAKE